MALIAGVCTFKKGRKVTVKKPKSTKKPLTTQEERVRLWLLKGYPCIGIAAKMQVCDRTVKFHLTNLYKKENVSGIREFLAKEIKRLQDLSNKDATHENKNVCRTTDSSNLQKA